MTRLLPRHLCYTVFWLAAEESRLLVWKDVYVWYSSDGGYDYGVCVPLSAITVAIFFMERLVYCKWDDAQPESELDREIKDYDERKIMAESRRRMGTGASLDSKNQR